ncbi:MAG: glycerophosphodiester phosphodiesterase [Clostridiales bacterium]|nr:glycerophosphodiester phosphodiesterase [Clostridiales bacterium]
MPRIIAHRGASAHAPENTMPAFELAIEMGAEGIELDVHLSKDNEVVVIHDATINRTSDGEGIVKDMTLEELRKFDFGKWFGDEFEGTHIPALKEVLELLKDWDGLLNIEIKGHIEIYAGIEQRVIDLIEAYNMKDNVIISAFNHFYLRNIKNIDPDIKIGLLYGVGLVEPWLYAKNIGAEALHPSYHAIDSELIDGCRKSNVILNPYTIDEIEDIRRMIDLGVDGIITDYPDRVLAVRDKG